MSPSKLFSFARSSSCKGMLIAHLIWRGWASSYNPMQSFLQRADARLRFGASSARAHLLNKIEAVWVHSKHYLVSCIIRFQAVSLQYSTWSAFQRKWFCKIFKATTDCITWAPRLAVSAFFTICKQIFSGWKTNKWWWYRWIKGGTYKSPGRPHKQQTKDR